jgi:hypothetical protein
MDTTQGWRPYTAPGNNSRWASPKTPLLSVPGQTGNAIKLGFDVQKDGWVGIFKNIYPGKIPNTPGIQFSYIADTYKDIELKIFQQVGDGEMLCFVDIDTSYGVGTWKNEQVLYSNLDCGGKLLDPTKIIRIDFAISIRQYGEPGAGEVMIDDIRAMCP